MARRRARRGTRTTRRTRKRVKGKSKLAKVRAYMKQLASKWKKLSQKQKAKYEGKFSEYVKVMMEKKFKAKKRK